MLLSFRGSFQERILCIPRYPDVRKRLCQTIPRRREPTSKVFATASEMALARPLRKAAGSNISPPLLYSCKQAPFN